MSLLTSMRYGLARMLLKAGGLSVVSPWIKTSFLEPTFDNLTREGYQKNAVVTACIQQYTFAMPEPPLMVWDGEGDDAIKLTAHPLRQLLRRPNPIMGEDEFWQYIAAYMALGGNAYGVASLNGAGRPVELWPYHAGQVRPAPGGPSWIVGYEFLNDNGDWERIDPNLFAVCHFKWPLPDPIQPWLAQPPLRSAARAVDTDSELDRYLFALLKNDAVPRTLITIPEGRDMAPDERMRFRNRWRELFSGSSRGDVGILEEGMKVERVSLNLEELAFDALRKTPEARIAAAFRVPPILVGLNVGLEHATYSNYEQARRAFTQDGLVPLWRSLAAEVENALTPLFGGGVFVRHDLNAVASLQEDTNARWSRVSQAWNDGAITLNEYRQQIGHAEQPNGDFYMIDPNKRPILASQITLAFEQPAPVAALPDGGTEGDEDEAE